MDYSEITDWCAALLPIFLNATPGRFPAKPGS